MDVLDGGGGSDDDTDGSDGGKAKKRGGLSREFICGTVITAMLVHLACMVLLMFGLATMAGADGGNGLASGLVGWLHKKDEIGDMMNKTKHSDSTIIRDTIAVLQHSQSEHQQFVGFTCIGVAIITLIYTWWMLLEFAAARWVQNRKAKEPFWESWAKFESVDLRDKSVWILLLYLTVSYIGLVKEAIKVRDCVEGLDGVRRMASNAEIACGVDSLPSSRPALPFKPDILWIPQWGCTPTCNGANDGTTNVRSNASATTNVPSNATAATACRLHPGTTPGDETAGVFTSIFSGSSIHPDPPRCEVPGGDCVFSYEGCTYTMRPPLFGHEPDVNWLGNYDHLKWLANLFAFVYGVGVPVVFIWIMCVTLVLQLWCLCLTCICVCGSCCPQVFSPKEAQARGLPCKIRHSYQQDGRASKSSSVVDMFRFVSLRILTNRNCIAMIAVLLVGGAYIPSCATVTT